MSKDAGFMKNLLKSIANFPEFFEKQAELCDGSLIS